MLNYEKLNKNNLIKKYKNPIKMEITKSTSFNLMPSTENNPMIDDIPDLLENRDEKPFIKFFSISPMNKKVINDLMMDETRDFLMNLIACNDEDSKETAEIDYEISLKHSKNPFLHADDLFDSKEQYKKKFQILEEKKQSKINYDSQEEINDPEIRKKVEETRQIRKKDSNNDAKLKEEVFF